MSRKTWKDYRKELENGESYSERITGSGHITVSAILGKHGELRAFPPKAREDAFPAFIELDASSGGKISETLDGVYPQKGWEFSCEMHHARAKLWRIFLDHYEKVRNAQAEQARREQARRNFAERAFDEADTGDIDEIEILANDKLWEEAAEYSADMDIVEYYILSHYAYTDGDQYLIKDYGTKILFSCPLSRYISLSVVRLTDTVEEEHRYFVISDERDDGKLIKTQLQIVEVIVEVDDEQKVEAVL